METKSPGFWWVKSPLKHTENVEDLVIPKLDLNSTSSLSDLLEKESFSKTTSPDVDVGSILEEINRVAAQSPLGPFEKSIGDRSIDDIMKEAEKVYMKSSKSFEQLSQRSKTSQNITDFLSSHSKNSTPTPKSISPLPMDPGDSASEYSDDFSQESKRESQDSPSLKCDKEFFDAQEDHENANIEKRLSVQSSEGSIAKVVTETSQERLTKIVTESSQEMLAKILAEPSQHESPRRDSQQKEPVVPVPKTAEYENVAIQVSSLEIQELKQEITFRNRLIEILEEDNKILKGDIEAAKMELDHTHTVLKNLRLELNTKTLSSPEINLELEKALENLKDSREINTALQLQLDAANKTHQNLKSSYEDLLASKKILERKVVELESSLSKYKTELFNVQKAKDKLVEKEASLNKLLEIEKLQSKSLKLQNDKDSRCIQDLNRQIKEMERIIARKHPDSVSALIVAAKENATDTNLTARKVLEDRIRTLEQEVLNRDAQSSKVFLEIHEKFNQMKNKYESHIDDLELHVSDLKNQLNKRLDTFDVYTQTIVSDEKIIPQKESFTIFTQTDNVVVSKGRGGVTPSKRAEHVREVKEDAHLLATIRGLQADLSNKEKVISRLQRDIEEVRKTNKRLQKEREGSLRNLSDRREFRSYPEKLTVHSRSGSAQDFRKDEELQQVKTERDRLKQQLGRLEEDYQVLKKKRLDDLTALQDAHEREVANYVTSVTPLREQLELQQVSIATLQSQLSAAKEELTIVTVERDHLNNRLLNTVHIPVPGCKSETEQIEVENLRKKIAFLEKQYEEKEYRLRAIVHGLAQKNVTNRSCEQCAERQQQLISYKVELDQLLATVRALQ